MVALGFHTQAERAYFFADFSQDREPGRLGRLHLRPSHLCEKPHVFTQVGTNQLHDLRCTTRTRHGQRIYIALPDHGPSGQRQRLGLYRAPPIPLRKGPWSISRECPCSCRQRRLGRLYPSSDGILMGAMVPIGGRKSRRVGSAKA